MKHQKEDFEAKQKAYELQRKRKAQEAAAAKANPEKQIEVEAGEEEEVDMSLPWETSGGSPGEKKRQSRSPMARRLTVGASCPLFAARELPSATRD